MSRAASIALALILAAGASVAQGAPETRIEDAPRFEILPPPSEGAAAERGETAPATRGVASDRARQIETDLLVEERRRQRGAPGSKRDFIALGCVIGLGILAAAIAYGIAKRRGSPPYS